MKGKFMFLLYVLLAQSTDEKDPFTPDGKDPFTPVGKDQVTPDGKDQITPDGKDLFSPRLNTRSTSVESPRKSSKNEKKNSAKRRIFEYFSDPEGDEKKVQHVQEAYNIQYSCPICCFDIQKYEDVHITCHKGGRFKHGYHFLCYQKMLKYDPNCPVCRKPLAKVLKKTRSDTSFDSSFDSSTVEDRYYRYRNFFESNLAQIINHFENESFNWQENDNNREAQYSEPFPSGDVTQENHDNHNVQFAVFPNDRMEVCSVGRYRFHAGREIISSPQPNGNLFVRYTTEEVIDIIEIYTDDVFVYGKLKLEPGWIVLKSLIGNVLVGEFQPENIFTDINLDAVQFGDFGNNVIDSGRGILSNNAITSGSLNVLNIGQDSFDIVNSEDDETSLEVNESQSTIEQNHLNESFQPSLSSDEGEFQPRQETTNFQKSLQPSNLNPLQSRLLTILKEPVGFSINLDVFNNKEQREELELKKHQQYLNFNENSIEDALDKEISTHFQKSDKSELKLKEPQEKEDEDENDVDEDEHSDDEDEYILRPKLSKNPNEPKKKE